MSNNCYLPPGYPCASGLCQGPHFLQITMRKANKQVMMPSSQMILRKRGLNVTQWLAQGENNNNSGGSSNSMNAGGPGDLVPSVQVSIRAGIKGNKARVVRRGARGVDKKHNSYNRYLARRVGKVLRQERSAVVAGRTAIIGQPINRTRTKCGCGRRTSGTAMPSDICCTVAANSATPGRLPPV